MILTLLASANVASANVPMTLDTGAMQLKGKLKTGYAYRVQQSTDLKTWNKVTDYVRGEDAMASFPVSRSASGPTFYRCQVDRVYSPANPGGTWTETVPLDSNESITAYSDGTYRWNSYAGNIAVIITGTWDFVEDPENLNKGTFSMHINNMRAPAYGISGSPQYWANLAGEPSPTTFVCTMTYTGVETGRISSYVDFTDGHRETQPEEDF